MLKIKINPDATIATIEADEINVTIPIKFIEEAYNLIASRFRRLERVPSEMKEHKKFGSTIVQYDGDATRIIMNGEKFNLTEITDLSAAMKEVESGLTE